VVLPARDLIVSLSFPDTFPDTFPDACVYSNNISKFLLSMGPHTTKVKDHWYIDHTDDAVRGMLTVEQGKLMWPAPLPPPPPPKKGDDKVGAAGPIVIDYRAPYMTGVFALGSALGTSGLLGWHMTASIGGADMPVVITVLNSYSGWALCAEGFMLDMPILTTVGALIGCSGAALTKIMCDAMNRDILSVILGGYGTKASGGGEAMKFEGEATTTC
jgi:hypothetical protein